MHVYISRDGRIEALGIPPAAGHSKGLLGPFSSPALSGAPPTDVAVAAAGATGSGDPLASSATATAGKKPVTVMVVDCRNNDPSSSPSSSGVAGQTGGGGQVLGLDPEAERTFLRARAAQLAAGSSHKR